MPPEASAEKPSFWSWALFTVYCIEAGIVLALLPWTRFWEANGLFHHWPVLMRIGVAGATRGVVTALGVFVFFLGVESFIRRVCAARPRGIAPRDETPDERDGA